MDNKERREVASRVKLIGKIMDIYRERDVNRPDYWYGEMFDKLYEKTHLQLSSLLKVITEIK